MRLDTSSAVTSYCTHYVTGAFRGTYHLTPTRGRPSLSLHGKQNLWYLQGLKISARIGCPPELCRKSYNWIGSMSKNFDLLSKHKMKHAQIELKICYNLKFHLENSKRPAPDFQLWLYNCLQTISWLKKGSVEVFPLNICTLKLLFASKRYYK